MVKTERAAINNLEATQYGQLEESKIDNTWSKIWLLQGTNKPW